MPNGRGSCVGITCVDPTQLGAVTNGPIPVCLATFCFPTVISPLVVVLLRLAKSIRFQLVPQGIAPTSYQLRAASQSTRGTAINSLGAHRASTILYTGRPAAFILLCCSVVRIEILQNKKEIKKEERNQRKRQSGDKFLPAQMKIRPSSFMFSLDDPDYSLRISVRPPNCSPPYCALCSAIMIDHLQNLRIQVVQLNIHSTFCLQ